MHRCVFTQPQISNKILRIVAPAVKTAVLAACLLLAPLPASAQGLLGGLGGLLGGLLQQLQQLLTSQQGLSSVVIPASSLLRPGDLGARSHTNVRFMTLGKAAPSTTGQPPYGGYFFETPQSLACIYHVVTPISYCNPGKTTNTPSGGSNAIAIVDAYDDPKAVSDLENYSAQFGIPFSASDLVVVYASGTKPPLDPSGGWEVEEALDVDMAHAMAPYATIYLVEAASSNFSDLFAAVKVASNLIACDKTTTCPSGSTGKGEVSMSWGGSEFAGETSYDSYFQTPNVVYFAASGDFPGTSYPCASQYVVCVGGTSTARQYTSGNFVNEVTWTEAGGGVSGYVPSPPYQSQMGEDIQYGVAGNPPPSGSSGQFPNRAVPDVALDSNPNTGVWVYGDDPVAGYPAWYILGGTSVATPLMAAIMNQAGQFPASSTAALTELYASHPSGYFKDVNYGACGPYSGFRASSGWDLCTGLGAPRTLSGH
jgi:subtilase family serine protease